MTERSVFRPWHTHYRLHYSRPRSVVHAALQHPAVLNGAIGTHIVITTLPLPHVEYHQS